MTSSISDSPALFFQRWFSAKLVFMVKWKDYSLSFSTPTLNLFSTLFFIYHLSKLSISLLLSHLYLFLVYISWSFSLSHIPFPVLALAHSLTHISTSPMLIDLPSLLFSLLYLSNLSFHDIFILQSVYTLIILYSFLIHLHSFLNQEN